MKAVFVAVVLIVLIARPSVAFVSIARANAAGRISSPAQQQPLRSKYTATSRVNRSERTFALKALHKDAFKKLAEVEVAYANAQKEIENAKSDEERAKLEEEARPLKSVISAFATLQEIAGDLEMMDEQIKGDNEGRKGLAETFSKEFVQMRGLIEDEINKTLFPEEYSS
jgi:hypothetical protein